MMRPRTDLEEIDRQLEALGRPRQDISAVVARYLGQSDHTEPQFEQLLATLSDAANKHAEPGMAAQNSTEDHDEFELLVDDEAMAEIEDDQLEAV